MMPRIATALILVAAGAAHAQLTSVDLPQIEQGSIDVNPLAIPQLVQPLDLQVPNDFTTLHEVQAPDGSTQFVRFAGGTAAVFPRSVYLPTRDGFLPDIPPSTVFYIDGLPSNYSAPDAAGASVMSPYRISYRLSLADHAPPIGMANHEDEQQQAQSPTALGSSVWIGEVHRRKRISFLLDSAAMAHHSD